jgi:hypothetical protein
MLCRAGDPLTRTAAPPTCEEQYAMSQPPVARCAGHCLRMAGIIREYRPICRPPPPAGLNSEYCVCALHRVPWRRGRCGNHHDIRLVLLPQYPTPLRQLGCAADGSPCTELDGSECRPSEEGERDTVCWLADVWYSRWDHGALPCRAAFGCCLRVVPAPNGKACNRTFRSRRPLPAFAPVVTRCSRWPSPTLRDASGAEPYVRRS